MQRLILAFLTAALVVAGLSLLPAQGAETSSAPTIRVEADGMVMAIPDQATLTLEVETQAATAVAAAQANARQAEGLLKALKPALGPQDEVRTLGYRLMPVYSPKDKSSPPQVKAYRAVNRLEVKIMNVSRLGALIDLALKSGASRINGPFFRHSRLAELQQQAAVDALKRARGLANALAQAAGLKIKGIKELSSGMRLIIPRTQGINYLKAAAKAETPTPIQVGEEEIKAHVRAVFLVSP